MLNHQTNYLVPFLFRMLLELAFLCLRLMGAGQKVRVAVWLPGKELKQTMGVCWP